LNGDISYQGTQGIDKKNEDLKFNIGVVKCTDNIPYGRMIAV
jgi:hypothetical protein